MMYVIGYGNPGRGDDGLGQAFAARIDTQKLPGVTVLTDYQLSVDHALTIAEAEKVVFVDALMHSDGPFQFARVQSAASHDLSSHSLSPSAVLALAATLFDATPQAYVLGIGGQVFGEVREGLSAPAKQNIKLAETFFLEWLRNPQAHENVSGCAHA